MPVLGLGVWQMDEGAETENAVEWALEAGYRHVDTAQLYRNERSVGAAIGRSGIPREEIFVTTKWLPTVRSAGPALEQSLERLGMAYVDLYLIHWPVPLRAGSRGWRDMEELVDRGLARAVGVSNYGDDRLEKTVAGARIKPAVNQVLFSPFHYRRELLDTCDRLGVVLESYSPLEQGSALDDPTVVAHRPAHRAHAGAGAPPLGRPEEHDRDPEIEPPRADRRERADLRLRARRLGHAGARRARPHRRNRARTLIGRPPCG